MPIKLKQLLNDERTVDNLHMKYKNNTKSHGCNEQRCLGSILNPKPVEQRVRTRQETWEQAKDFIDNYYASIKRLDTLAHKTRLKEIEKQLSSTDTYYLKETELIYGAKLAWRNAPRCIGRIQWSKLQVFDARFTRNASEMFEAICNHIKYATNKGSLRSAITIFPQRVKSIQADWRIWNAQLIGYAGHRSPETGQVVGDRANVELTDICKRLGWSGGSGGEFDVLPLVLQANGGAPEMFELPEELVLRVKLKHPRHSWFEELGLEWYALPAVSGMMLDVGGLQFTACPFSGWYMVTEIGSRDLGDKNRYNKLELVAKKLGLSTTTNMSLWKDQAVVEMNVAVLDSFQQAGVTIVDHHTACETFMTHLSNEQRLRGGCPADWVWLVPPTAGSTTPVFHQEMVNYHLLPNYEYQFEPWRGFDWLAWERGERERKLAAHSLLAAIGASNKSSAAAAAAAAALTTGGQLTGAAAAAAAGQGINQALASQSQAGASVTPLTKLQLSMSGPPSSTGSELTPRHLRFKEIARAVKFTSKLFGKALSRRIKATIVYATETGRSERFANKLAQTFSHAFNVHLMSMSDYDMACLEHEALLLIVTSTFGNGDPPENGELFAKHLAAIKKTGDTSPDIESINSVSTNPFFQMLSEDHKDGLELQKKQQQQQQQQQRQRQRQRKHRHLQSNGFCSSEQNCLDAKTPSSALTSGQGQTTTTSNGNAPNLAQSNCSCSSANTTDSACFDHCTTGEPSSESCRDSSAGSGTGSSSSSSSSTSETGAADMSDTCQLGPGPATAAAAAAMVFQSANSDGNHLEANERQLRAQQQATNNNIRPLSNVRFAVFALGSTAYPHFCAFGRYVDQTLDELGAERIHKCCCGDELCGQEKAFNEWASSVFKLACDTFCLTDQLEPGVEGGPETIWSPADVRFEAEAEAEDLSQSQSQAQQALDSKQVIVQNLINIVGKKIVPFTVRRRLDLHQYKVEENLQTICVDLDAGVRALKFQPGDHVGIYPANKRQVVERILARIRRDFGQPDGRPPAEGQPDKSGHRLALDFDRRLGILIKRGNMDPITQGDAWLACDTLPHVTSIREALTRYLDITNAPNQDFLLILSRLTSDQEEKKRLQQLGRNFTIYEEWKNKHAPSLASLLDEFQTVRFDPTLISQIPPMKPRFYSISGQSLSLTLGVVRYQTPSGEFREGLCSNYLNQVRLEPAAFVYGYVRSAPAFHMPKLQALPMILISAGTGLAPFRSFWQRRQVEMFGQAQSGAAPRTASAALREMRQTFEEKRGFVNGADAAEAEADNSFGPIDLYFGCRNANYILYKEELEQMLHCGVLASVNYAFSRPLSAESSSSSSSNNNNNCQQQHQQNHSKANGFEGKQPKGFRKMYVQDKLLENGPQVFGAIASGAHIYVCGDVAMADGVYKTLAKIINQNLRQPMGDKFTLGNDGESALMNLRNLNRYHEDIFGARR